MVTLLIFIAVISVLVLVHELGHFWVARRAGMRVDEFGFGFPPRLWGIRRGNTLYSINLIPFGGFVRIYGEDGEHRTVPGSFGGGTFGQKVAVIVAGVAMNFLFAVVLLVLGNFMGLRVGVFDDATAARATDSKVQVLQVAPASPAEAGGLRVLDEIIGFRDGRELVRIANPDDVQRFAFDHAGNPVTMVVRRGQAEVDVPLALRRPTMPGEGPIGISLAQTGVIRYPWHEALWRGVVSAAQLFWITLAGYGQLFATIFTDGKLAADVSGPIGIATLTGQAARVGFNYLLQFVAMISVNLAVLNLMPFPALDGGRLAIVLAEKVRGKTLSRRVEEGINALGFAALIALMVAVTVKDIVKFF